MATRGSAPGERRGGRKKGTPNKAIGKVRPKVADVAGEGIMPLDYMLEVLRTDDDPARRAWAAKEAAPYCHPKLAQIDHGNKNDVPFKVNLGTTDGGIL